MYNKNFEGNFYKVFLFLFYDENYSNLPINAKLMYVLLSDKNDLSKQTAEQGNTQFFDEHNRLYSIYSNKDLATDLKINIKSVPRLKKQLKEKGLLCEEQQGLGLSNRIYPKQPYTDGFIYKYDISKWFLLPKDLFAYKYYNELDNQTKVFYAILYNTFRYSEKKGQYIHNGKIYCSLTYNKIQEITGFRREKIKEMKEELRKKHLITYENGGFSKADRFYIHLPQISKNMEITDSNTWNHLKKESITVKYINDKMILNMKNKGYKLRHIKGVTKWNRWKSQNGTNGSNKTELMEVTKRNSNKTYIIKPYSIKTHLNYTTTKDQKSSGGYSKKDEVKNNLISKIKDEYQIYKLTKTYERKIQTFNNIFSSDIMTYAIEYAGEKSTTSPTNLLMTILTNWEQAGVQTLEQAKAQESKYRSGKGNVKHNQSIEKTPQWLLDRDKKQEQKEELTDEELKKFEEDKRKLKEQMASFWND